MNQDYNKVREYCVQMNSVNNDMQKSLENIKLTINMIKNNWSGNVAEDFLQRFTNLSANFYEFSNELNACIQYMKKCSSNYEEIDNEVKKNIESLLATSKFFS